MVFDEMVLGQKSLEKKKNHLQVNSEQMFNIWIFMNNYMQIYP